ncbi:MAG: glycosyltransferase family 2 protein [Deferribacteraceae bacterium]|jgi:glycosyltransferase involved in cell wall biosynthesis|nr:glycosyltransferase family 2 protein [Deferribacteraceae bacterium]
MKLSVSIISFNEEKNIARTLEAVKGLADEIIVVDSLSTDNTVALAESVGAKVFIEKWKGHIAQKNSALEKCSGEWILALDCDEVVTPELRESIEKVIKGESDFCGYAINRRTFYMGRLLRYSWQPDWKLRFVRKSAAPAWGGYDPHDVLHTGGRISKLSGDLIHYSYKNFADHIQKTVKYAEISAKSYAEKEKKSGFWALLLKPFLVFFKKLIAQRGILDGVPGVMAAFSGAVYVYIKYAFLWELNRNNDKQQ